MWLLTQSGFDETIALAQDGIKFIHNFSSAISHSTPHLYISALPFTPLNTLLAKMMMLKFSYLVQIAHGGLEDWPAVQLSLQGHNDIVSSVAFSPDGKRIVSGSWDKTVRVWDAERGVQIGSPLKGHTGTGKSPQLHSPLMGRGLSQAQRTRLRGSGML
ncbi:hypothetical protein M404DRAFT_961384 [Pisolithus tinctorius Marx 270]|uniref:Uncharacterized protein n=1 Tax=Pisolithus tinctorius Marx 270 TaxID=870435 RepID=A0A0C3P343_PISTI|nr:hypothetical protein M404DRAFT_961384 [Pisolithus tinctorius Marx 270]